MSPIQIRLGLCPEQVIMPWQQQHQQQQQQQQLRRRTKRESNSRVSIALQRLEEEMESGGREDEMEMKRLSRPLETHKVSSTYSGLSV